MLCVGIAYLLIAVLVPVGALRRRVSSELQPDRRDHGDRRRRLGALGAVCIIYAFRAGGTPLYRDAARVRRSAAHQRPDGHGHDHPPKGGVNPMLYLGFLLASLGAGMVLYFRPASLSPALESHRYCDPMPAASADARAMADLRHCRAGLRLRHLRDADGAARRRPAIGELTGVKPGTPDFNYWVGMFFWVPALVGGAFGLLGGYLTDRFGRRRVLVWSILLYAFSALAAGFATSI